MFYQDLVSQGAQFPRFEWNGRRSLGVKRSLPGRIIFWFGAVNLIYHNIGCFMYGYFVDGSTKDVCVSNFTTAAAFVAATHSDNKIN